jgi:hypothetical protein
MTHTVWIGWEHPDTDEPYRVRLAITPGREGYLSGPPERCYPPEGPEVEVLDVLEDWPGGQRRLDLADLIQDSLDTSAIASDYEPEPWPRRDR